MSKFSGAQGKGAMTLYRARKREEAKARNQCYSEGGRTWCGHSHDLREK